MKPVSSTYISYLLTQQRMPFAELYTFEFLDGNFAYYTNLDRTIFYGGNAYLASELRIEGLKYKIGVGFQVDEQEIRIGAYPGETLGGAAFFSALQEGLLDGAYLTRQRAFWQPSDGRPFIDFQSAPFEVITLFAGRVSTITKIGRSHVELKLKSPLSLLDIDMPRNTYQPGCQWTLYDSGCTLSRPSFTTSFTVLTANTTSIQPTGPIAATGADGIPNYYQGRLLFTSGVNDNLQIVIGNNDGTSFFTQYPLVVAPDPGDTFDASLGCSKQNLTCNDKFSNLANFRGFPRVPPVVIGI